MNLYSTLLGGMVLAVLLSYSPQATAQCSAPNYLSLTSPKSSTSLTLQWPAQAGADSYEIRYWPTSSPDLITRVESVLAPPFTLRGLQKNTYYTLEIRSKCGQTYSAWTGTLQAKTYNSSGSCSGPLNLTVTPGNDYLSLHWTSTYSHGIRYRLENTPEWIIPAGGMATLTAPFVINGLAPGTYQIALQRNCSGTSSDALEVSATIAGVCPTPPAPAVSAGINQATLTLPSLPGVIGFDIYHRPLNGGAWMLSDTEIPAGTHPLNASLMPETAYEVRIQAVCSAGMSGFSLPTAFTTLPQVVPPSSSCLAHKDAGKNMSLAELNYLRQILNSPSQFTYNGMIGVNDGGLVFRSFQNSIWNQIIQLTTQFRNFHTMDEDFDASLQSYDLNIKPKNTTPEGTPGNIGYNKGLYTLYRQHGFLSITSSTEILQYSPQSWKEKIYQEDDWSAQGAAGIRASYRNYTRHFIDAFAPAGGVGMQLLAANFQVGNELWDYPDETDYHQLLYGAWDAFNEKYGPKSAGGWKMGLAIGAFQAYRDDNCHSQVRNFSNCGGALERHDFIGNYLNLQECQVLKDLDAIDCHPYSFKHRSLNWTYPEDPESESTQIQHLAAWLLANRNEQTGILANTRLWASEFGFDSNPQTGVGELTHSAYLLRGLMLHSRYHFEKVFFYNAYDVNRPSDMYYTGLYNSSGFWRLGTHPANSAWASPLEEHGATPKPAWHGMLDFKGRLGNHVFFKALLEQDDAYVYLLAKPDSTEPYLVFWSPSATNDANLNQNITLIQMVQWADVLPAGYTISGANAQVFAENQGDGEQFEALANTGCGTLTLHTIRRNPAFAALQTCASARPENEERSDDTGNNGALRDTWMVFPNPGKSHLQVQYNGLGQAFADLQIINSTGQIVLTKSLQPVETQQPYRLETSHLAAGIYFVRFQTDKSVEWVIWEKG